MRIFNSVGSNYAYTDAVQHILAKGSDKNSQELASFLASRYDGSVQLYYRGRGALTAGLKTAGVEGKEVVLNGFTCYAVEQAITASGAMPVFVDATKTGYNFGLTNLKKGITKNTAAVIVQNTFGLAVDIEPIESFCKENGIMLIEDLAHSLGSVYPDGREVGTVGDITMLSFGRDKHIDVVNGGALIVRNTSLSMPSHPQQKASLFNRLRDRIYPMISWKTRALYNAKIGILYFRAMRALRLVTMASDGGVLDAVALPNHRAKIVLKQFESIGLSRLRKREVAELYGLQVREDENVLRVPVTVKNKAKFLAEAKRAGFNLHDTWYDSPIYPARYMKESLYKRGQCPNAEETCKNLVNLPVHKNISKKQAAKLSKIVEQHV